MNSSSLNAARFLTFNAIIRVNQIEVTRTESAGADEYDRHHPAAIVGLREAIERGFPGARITWALSWQALHDPRPHYVEARRLVRRFHREMHDDVTFIPGGFFANAYNSVEQINRDMDEGLALVENIIGDGYTPASIVAGFLSARNQAHLADRGIHVCQGNIWSQYDVDNQDGDGSISYPYYPSREHFCKPAQGAHDFIDCVNLDGWTCDFLAARRPGRAGGFNSRMGLGPIETIGRHSAEDAQRQLMHTAATHFDTGVQLNGWAWLTTAYEVTLVEELRADNVLSQLEQWLTAMRRRWPDTVFTTIADFGRWFRTRHADNTSLNYRFVQRGSGIGGSDADKEMRWWMNRDFRLATLGQIDGEQEHQVIDFTRYDQPAREPATLTRRWSLMGQINQKGTRPQDRPVGLGELPEADQQLIRSCCPELAVLPC